MNEKTVLTLETKMLKHAILIKLNPHNPFYFNTILEFI